jgi:cobalt/nickel transport system permease protein
MTSAANPLVTLSLFWLPLLALTVGMCLWLATRALRRLAAAAKPPPKNFLIAELTANAKETSAMHRWDPRFKLAGLLIFMFLVVSLSHPLPVGIALLLALAAVSLARLPWQRPLSRLLAMNGFLVMLLVVLPLSAKTQSGDTLVVLDGLPGLHWNLRGLVLALTIIGKAWTVALLMEPMLATAPLPITLAGLSRLGSPRKLTELLLLSHRYLFVFADEAARMRTGMATRGFRPRSSLTTLKALGNFFGMLLVRSFERTERVQQAMLARGYTGELPHQYDFNADPADWLGALVCIGLGLALLITDRLVGG